MEVSAQVSTQQALTGLQSDVSALAQTAPEETTNQQPGGSNGIKVPAVDSGEDASDASVVSAQVEEPEGQGSTGANILAAANNQEQSGAQDVRDLFENNDDQKELS